MDPVLCQDRRQEGGKSFLAATLRNSENKSPGCFRLETPVLSERLEKVGRFYLMYGMLWSGCTPPNDVLKCTCNAVLFIDSVLKR